MNDDNLTFTPGTPPSVPMAPTYDTPRPGQSESMTRAEFDEMRRQQAERETLSTPVVVAHRPNNQTQTRYVNGRELNGRNEMRCYRCDCWKPQAMFEALEPAKGHLSTRSPECNQCTRTQLAKLQELHKWQRQHCVGPFSPEAKAEEKLERRVSIGMRKCPGCGVEFLPTRKNQIWHSTKCKRRQKYLERKKKAKQT